MQGQVPELAWVLLRERPQLGRNTWHARANTESVALVCQGDSWVQKHDRSSLRVLGSVGEPINPRAWQWLFEVQAHPLQHAAAMQSASHDRGYLGVSMTTAA